MLIGYALVSKANGSQSLDLLRDSLMAEGVEPDQIYEDRRVDLRVLAGQGIQIDTTTAGGRLVFGIFAALAEFERELIRERAVAGLKTARSHGCKGGRKFALSKA